jgi:hypothetical protein
MGGGIFQKGDGGDGRVGASDGLLFCFRATCTAWARVELDLLYEGIGARYGGASRRARVGRSSLEGRWGVHVRPSPGTSGGC